jgi:hypothetical protein
MRKASVTLMLTNLLELQNDTTFFAVVGFRPFFQHHGCPEKLGRDE